jgi:membrane-associated phospholipid phosphatase
LRVAAFVHHFAIAPNGKTSFKIDMTDYFPRLALIALLIALAIACGMVGGLGNPIDVALIRDGIAARAASPLPVEAGLFLNYAGGVAATLGLGVVAAVVLWRRNQTRLAITVISIALLGRALVEVVKLTVRRARPALDAHPITLHSLSFPSGHAANSMIVLPLLAMVFAPAARRAPWVVLGVLASLVIGASRSLIGVHWPSDVVAGWAIGGAWLIATWPLVQRLAPLEAQHDVVRGHDAAFGEV